MKDYFSPLNSFLNTISTSDWGRRLAVPFPTLKLTPSLQTATAPVCFQVTKPWGSTENVLSLSSAIYLWNAKEWYSGSMQIWNSVLLQKKGKKFSLRHGSLQTSKYSPVLFSASVSLRCLINGLVILTQCFWIVRFLAKSGLHF